MVNMREEGIIVFNLYTSLITPALIGHTFCLNAENASFNVTSKILQHQTAVKSGEETDSGCCLLSSTRVAAHCTWGVPYEAVLIIFSPLCCHHCSHNYPLLSLPVGPGTAVHQNNLNTHAHAHKALLQWQPGAGTLGNWAFSLQQPTRSNGTFLSCHIGS